ncbi:hypothetical protein P886_3267 [Alteromonadaceae bacterium 2753L.S.0a.02]|nr:hypothetical protein P886_3267 [Alteromonadaceae bacterium 2753L.S.0a.02]
MLHLINLEYHDVLSANALVQNCMQLLAANDVVIFMNSGSQLKNVETLIELDSCRYFYLKCSLATDNTTKISPIDIKDFANFCAQHSNIYSWY